METPKKVSRKFAKSYLQLLQQAQTMHDLLEEDLALFSAQFPFIDGAYVTNFQTAIDTADAEPDDEEVLDSQQLITQSLEQRMHQGRSAFTTLLTYVSLAFPGDEAVMEFFGQKRYRRARFVQLEMKELMELAHKHADSAGYKPALLAMGYTQLKIDELGTIAGQLKDENKEQESAKVSRPVWSQSRVVKHNDVFDIMTEVNKASKVVFENDFAKLQQYLLYHEGGGNQVPNVSVSGILRDNVTNNPIEDAVIQIGNKSTMTDVDGAFEIFFYISEPTTYNVTITKAGYETVNTTVQFVPDVNVVQDLEMEPAVATGSVTGSVTNNNTMMPLEGVLVSSDAGGVSVITDGSGIYNLTGVPVGSRTITFSKTGFVTKQEVVNVGEGGTVILAVALLPLP